jgi:hypothetical protein
MSSKCSVADRYRIGPEDISLRPRPYLLEECERPDWRMTAHGMASHQWRCATCGYKATISTIPDNIGEFLAATEWTPQAARFDAGRGLFTDQGVIHGAPGQPLRGVRYWFALPSASSSDGTPWRPEEVVDFETWLE